MSDSASLRSILLEELTSLRTGKTDAIRAKAVAALANTMLKSVEVEMAYREQAAKDVSLPALGGMPLLAAPRHEQDIKPTDETNASIDIPDSLDIKPAPTAKPQIPPHLLGSGARTVKGSRY